MKKTVAVLSALSVSLVLLTSPVYAQEDAMPAAAKYKLKKLKTTDFKGIPRLLDWVMLNEKSSIVFALDHMEHLDPEINCLRSFVLSNKGKIEQTNELLSMTNGEVRDAAAFWFNGEAPSAGHGLLIVAIRPENVFNVIQFATAGFDAAGRLTSEFQTLLEVTAPEGRQHAGSWLGAARRGEIIGLALGVDHSEYSESFRGRRATEAYFMELTPDGALTPAGIVSVKLPNGGNFLLYHPYRPAWNGKSWMVPVVLTILKVEPYQGTDYTDEVGYQIAVLAATPTLPEGPIKLKLRRIAKDNTKIHWPTLYNPVFLPGATPTNPEQPTAGKTMDLLYTKAKPIGTNIKNFLYFIQPISDKGKKGGPKKKVKKSKWKLQYENTYNPTENFSNFSNALEGSNGEVLIALSRSAIYYVHAESGQYRDLQVDFYSLDPATGKVKQLATANYTGKTVFWPPMLRAFGSAPRSLNPCTDEKKGKQTRVLYFSKLPTP